jgi:hypothetical protein
MTARLTRVSGAAAATPVTPPLYIHPPPAAATTNPLAPTMFVNTPDGRSHLVLLEQTPYALRAELYNAQAQTVIVQQTLHALQVEHAMALQKLETEHKLRMEFQHMLETERKASAEARAQLSVAQRRLAEEVECHAQTRQWSVHATADAMAKAVADCVFGDTSFPSPLSSPHEDARVKPVTVQN